MYNNQSAKFSLPFYLHDVFSVCFLRFSFGALAVLYLLYACIFKNPLHPQFAGLEAYIFRRYTDFARFFLSQNSWRVQHFIFSLSLASFQCAEASGEKRFKARSDSVFSRRPALSPASSVVNAYSLSLSSLSLSRSSLSRFYNV